MNSRLLTRCALLLSLLGIFVSGVLALAHIAGTDVPCGLSSGCQTVAKDASAHMLGPDNAFLGIAAYLVLAILASMRLLGSTIAPRLNLLGAYLIAAVGTIFSGYLTYLEVFQIHAICVWCVSSAIIITLLLFTHAAEFQVRALETPAGPEAKPTKASLTEFGFIVAGFLVATGATFAVPSAAPPIRLAPIDVSVYKQFPLVPEGANIYGNPDAPVTIVEFADLQCPTCRAGYPKLKDIIARGNGKIRLVFRHFPLSGPEHDMALPAAAIAEYAATKNKFFDFVGGMYSADPDSLHKAEGILKVAQSVGLDTKEAQAAISDTNSEAFNRILNDVNAGSAYGLQYTPTFFVFLPGQAKPDLMLSADLEKTLGEPRYAKVISGAGS
jgi:protein-disulfide isomerase